MYFYMYFAYIDMYWVVLIALSNEKLPIICSFGLTQDEECLVHIYIYQEVHIKINVLMYNYSNWSFICLLCLSRCTNMRVYLLSRNKFRHNLLLRNNVTTEKYMLEWLNDPCYSPFFYILNMSKILFKSYYGSCE